MKDETFTEAVRAMREHQVALAAGDKSKSRVRSTAAAERKVDRALEASAPPRVDPRQLPLFGGA